MARAIRLLILLLAIVGLSAIATGLYVVGTGVSARAEPGAVETYVARLARRVAIGADARAKQNPVPSSPEVIAAGLAHFADHCASCHANDGSGNTALGRGLFPKPPDMRLDPTQRLTDGELFAIIENGIRFTGMPAFGTGSPEGEQDSWGLVHFIRHLPRLSDAEVIEMESLNPAPPAEIRQRLEEERFLQGLDDVPAAPAQPSAHRGH
jgi:mono/diheme cytochrome c family protein